MRKFTSESEKSVEIERELTWHEEIIKAQLDQWIVDVNKKAELESRLQNAFENSKSHVSSLSQM